jgi:hypothetical protein
VAVLKKFTTYGGLLVPGSKVKVTGIEGLNTAPVGPNWQGMEMIFSPAGAAGAPLGNGDAVTAVSGLPFKVPDVPAGIFTVTLLSDDLSTTTSLKVPVADTAPVKLTVPVPVTVVITGGAVVEVDDVTGVDVVVLVVVVEVVVVVEGVVAVDVIDIKLTVIEWLPLIELKVYEFRMLSRVPSTITPSTWYPEFAVMTNVWLVP